MSYDYSKLRGKIKEKCKTQNKFAELIGIGHVTLSKRLNNELNFTQDEILKACYVLDLPKDQIQEYFFAKKV